MNKALILITAAGAVLVAGAAVAGHHERGRHGGHMMKADANNDGIVSRDEFLAGINTHFKDLDRDADGKITQAEFQAKPLEHFTTADTNKDGQLTAEERKAMHEKMRQMWRDKKADETTK